MNNTYKTPIMNSHTNGYDSNGDFDIKNNKYIEDPWTIIESYFKDQHLDRLVRHQLESYNNFVCYQIIKTIEMFNPVNIKSDEDYDEKSGKYSLEMIVTFENFHIYRPQIHENNGAIKLMFPQSARLRNFTYASAMTLDINIKYIIRDGENLDNVKTLLKTLPKIHIGKLPIMLKSCICVLNQYKYVDNQHTGECKYDAGGYFIINGSEKTVLGQERAAENRVYCFNISKNDTKYTWKAEIKSVPDSKCISPKQINMMICSKNNGFGYPICIQIPRIKQPIPLFILFRALNVIPDKDICEYILLDISLEKFKPMLDNLKASVIEANKYLTYEDAIKYITSNVSYTPMNMDKETGAKKKSQFALEVLQNDLFPHCQTLKQKIYFLGYMANKLLQASFEWIKGDDRDSYINKRIDLTGTSLNNLFRNYFNKLVKDMEKQILKEIKTGSWRSKEDYLNIVNLTNIYKIIKSNTIENGFRRALSTGDFGIKHTNSNKVGVAQVLNRLTYIASLSHLRRVSTPTDKSGKLVPPRKLHNTSWGFICPAECFDPETEILMWDGSIKLAKDIVIGDTLIDDNGNATTVRTTCSGFKNMYDIIPDKPNFMKHRVTDNHILTLKIRGHKVIRHINSERKKYTHVVRYFNRDTMKFQEKSFNSLTDATNFINEFNDDDTIDITIEKYLNLETSVLNNLVLFKTNGINWTTQSVEMDPYLLGMWLGDGLSDGTGFALNYKKDFETLNYWEKWADENGALITKNDRYKYSIVSKKNKDAKTKGLCNRVEEAPLKKYLRKYNLLNNKHIPNDYIINDRETRLKVLAGLIDTDGSVRSNGHEIRISQGPTNFRVIEDAYTLAMSLGFSCGVKEGKSQWKDAQTGDNKYSTYKELTITGYNICDIPTLLPYKKLLPVTDETLMIRNKSFMCSKFKLEQVGIGPYVGWQLHDKRGRFCLKDGLVVHNTPEGASVGVVKNMSYMAHITVHSNSNSLYDYILPNILKIEDDAVSPRFVYDKVKVFINGAWVGISLNPVELFTELKEMKYKGIVNIYTSIIFDYRLNEIRVCNDSGRITRPLLRVKNNNILITDQIMTDLKEHKLIWDDLLISCKINDAVIEYIDPEEQCFSRIATKPKHIGENENHVINKFTHCEIHPSTIFGVVASCIPYPDHNQSPRNTYQCAQAKQAMGIYTTNFNERMDKTAYVLSYPTRPLVDTRVMNLIKLNENPSGCNITVAIMTHTGYNQEDSLLINKGSIDRGLLQITITHTEKDEDKQKINGDEEIRCKPDPTKTKGMKIANYNKVNSKGLVPENTLIENRDIIIAKVTPIKENRNDHTKIIKYEDGSKSYKTTEETYIDKNYIDRNGDGYSFAKVRLRSLRKPIIGDKFSSRHGQKGTVGNIIPEEDMPFTRNGDRPDIIINPHAIPSRMTIGQLKETQLGKVLIELGLFGDGTSFGELDVNTISTKLLELGYEAHGNELLHNGLTGEQIECSVFMGPVFYQRLKHMVADKQHSRASGPMVNLTRQPAEGRSRDGGLRFGEMERDCSWYHSPIPLTCGLSVELGTMEDNDYKSNVLGWDSVTDTLISSSQIGFMHKGKRECVDVTLQDGRKLRFTDNHKMLTDANTWVPINQFIIGETRLKTGVTYPLMKVMDEITECNNWSLNVGCLLETNTPDNYFKTLAFCRLLGYISADGGIYSKRAKFVTGVVNLGHMIDVNNVVTDLSYFCDITQTKFKCDNYYSIHLPDEFIDMLLTINSTVIGTKINQPTILPGFILDPACPKPIVREFLGGLFGADGHTCVLSMHRGKRDILTSISYSKCKHVELLDNLTDTFENIKRLFNRFDINNVTVQSFKETTYSKSHTDKPKTLQLTLHLGIDELIPFSEKIGFRYCCHKSQRLEAGVSYKRLKNEVARQRAWIINRIDELTDFKKTKEENPNKNIKTTKAIHQAVNELTQIEPIVHPYSIPTRHNVVDSLKNGSQLTIFRSGSFPTPEEYFKEIGAIEWFTTDVTQISYGVHRENAGLPTMNLKVIDIRPAGEHDVYDIEVEHTHSFLANGVVAHNCMVSHGASRFTRGRLYDASDKYQVHICKKCGLIASYNDKLHIHCCHTCDNRVDFAYVEIPYACKLLFQELTTMNVVPRIMTE